MRVKNQKSYTYLVNIDELEVRRVKNSFDKEYTDEVNRLMSIGYKRTTKEIYKRFVDGSLTDKSFVQVERPKGSGKHVTANIYQ